VGQQHGNKRKRKDYETKESISNKKFNEKLLKYFQKVHPIVDEKQSK
jgi:hypothetical protein